MDRLVFQEKIQPCLLVWWVVLFWLWIELSLLSALAAGHFVKSHMTMNRWVWFSNETYLCNSIV